GCGLCGRTDLQKYRKINVCTESFLPDYHDFGAVTGNEKYVLVDVGTTTIAMELCDGKLNTLKTYKALNPQTKYGADVMSRILKAMTKEGAEELRILVWDEILKGLKSFGELIGDSEVKILMAGNTAMTYILFGDDVKELSAAPFKATHLDMKKAVIRDINGRLYVYGSNSERIDAKDTSSYKCHYGNTDYCVGKTENGEDSTDNFANQCTEHQKNDENSKEATNFENTKSEIECIAMSGASAFVGGDIMAGIIGTGMGSLEEISLLVDLGTNGEMVLGNRHRLIACATAAGPAFEGYCSNKLFGSEIIGLVCRMLEKGVLDDTGLICDEYFDTGVTIGGTCMDNGMIRALQLAKAAVAAGITEMCRNYGIGFDDIKKVYIAGGFGLYLDVKDAARIGLIPKCLESKSISAGNTVLPGLKRHIADSKELPKVETYNLAEAEDFNDLYLSNLNLTPME
nr:ASKHA domain-containing protein [Lachnospiraceae bacterium]